jgi:hypothetical protein
MLDLKASDKIPGVAAERRLLAVLAEQQREPERVV